MENRQLARERKQLQKVPPLPWEVNMFLHATHVLHLKNHQLQLEFNDGRVKELDLKDELYGENHEAVSGCADQKGWLLWTRPGWGQDMQA
jgi:hypothetical protein